MQKCRCGRRQYTCHSQQNQGKIETHDEAVAAVDSLHKHFTELSQRTGSKRFSDAMVMSAISRVQTVSAAQSGSPIKMINGMYF